MGGGPSISYQQPEDPYGDALKKYQLQQLRRTDRETKEEERIKREQEEARKKQAIEGFTPYSQTIQNQLSRGLLSYKEAESALQDYSAKYDIGPQTSALQSLSDYYFTQVQPGQQKAQIESAYKELFGKGPTAEQLAEAQSSFQSGYYKSIGDLKETLKASDAYVEAKGLNKSYLENYYETMFGKAAKDEKGTSRYNFRFNEALMPTYAGDLAKETGVSLPKFQSQFTGTAGELEANLDAIKETKKYIYSAGLTNLQGEIDKQTQKLKNEGAKEIAKIQQGTGLYSAVISAFNF
jgi:hypothetical protein